MRHGFVDDRSELNPDWSAILPGLVALAMLLAPLGGMLALLLAGVMVGEGFIISEMSAGHPHVPEHAPVPESGHLPESAPKRNR